MDLRCVEKFCFLTNIYCIMKLNFYSNYSPSHKILFDEYFFKSFPHHEFNLHIQLDEQKCPSGNYHSQGYAESCLLKVKMLINACKNNMNSYFVFSDIDVQFFGNIKDILIEELGDYDIACQSDNHVYCAGFFICKCNKKTLALFEAMANDLECNLNNLDMDCQHMLNKYIPILGINAKYLSNKFITVGNIMSGVWDENRGEIIFPKDILMHHANFTIGVPNKIKLLEMVRKQINGGSR